MNFKDGDKVTCKICDTQIDDAMISIDEDGETFICHNKAEHAGLTAEDLKGYTYSYMIHRDFTHRNLTDLKLAPDVHPKVGDVYVNKNSDMERTVLEVGENLIALSKWDKQDIYNTHVTRAQLASHYTLKQEDTKWCPKIWKKYRYINVNGDIWECRWDNDHVDHARLSIGNVFPMEGTEAEEARERVIKAFKNE